MAPVPLQPQLPTHRLLHSSALLLKPGPLPGASLTLPLPMAGLRGECLSLHKDFAHCLALSRTFSHLTPAAHQGQTLAPLLWLPQQPLRVPVKKLCLSSCFLSTCPSTPNTSQPPTGSFLRAKKKKKTHNKKTPVWFLVVTQGLALWPGVILTPPESLRGWTAGRGQGRVGGWMEELERRMGPLLQNRSGWGWVR